jgi:hypothetical protein
MKGARYPHSNYPFHLTAARLRIGLNTNGLVWMAAEERWR